LWGCQTNDNAKKPLKKRWNHQPQYVVQSSFPPNFSEIDAVKRKVRRKRIKPEDTETNVPEQLSLICEGGVKVLISI
jgi:hypothetical protein